MLFFFFNDTATTEIYTLSLHDALPISTTDAGEALLGLYWLVANLADAGPLALLVDDLQWVDPRSLDLLEFLAPRVRELPRSEEHTSELQSRQYLVCRLLLEKKQNNKIR